MYFFKEPMNYLLSLINVYQREKYINNIYLRKIFEKIFNFFNILEYIILIILIYFSTIFHNYSNFLLGNNFYIFYNSNNNRNT